MKLYASGEAVDSVEPPSSNNGLQINGSFTKSVRPGRKVGREQLLLYGTYRMCGIEWNNWEMDGSKIILNDVLFKNLLNC